MDSPLRLPSYDGDLRYDAAARTGFQSPRCATSRQVRPLSRAASNRSVALIAADKTSLLHRARERVIGKPRDPMDPESRRHVALVAFFAWVGLGADGLSSACYGPEEAYAALGVHTPFGLYLAAATVVTVFIISLAAQPDRHGAAAAAAHARYPDGGVADEGYVNRTARLPVYVRALERTAQALNAHRNGSRKKKTNRKDAKARRFARTMQYKEPRESPFAWTASLRISFA